MHQAAPLQWSASLAALAQGWAATLAARGCGAELEHSAPGELLYWETGDDTRCRYAVDSWYSEAVFYNFDTPSPFADNVMFGSNDVSHFTQLVWAASTQVGCGLQVAGPYSRRCMFVACRFAVPGNSRSDVAHLVNVLPKVGSRR
ncbi:hypothetical protein GPECTOR_33g598 [Gonium pectorale]|uniref:SCP domain-containing protein n=1 Tax=Gonium pectorale TaxID=33097 RepID=A0A150GD03_GONPE|nr:hypothetical protein GPECTOR_33g598 [Gonium pectorale]|eukprot:KXZ47716.1 hypothetical protein GPECTOR_33g598 [Gonium pectorale]